MSKRDPLWDIKSFMQFEFKVEEASEKDGIGVIKGYASTFGNVDQGLDICDRGCFSMSINDKKGIFPILLDHDVTKQIGWNVQASEDQYGLKINGEIQLITEDAKNRYALAKRAQQLGTKSGLSIGYTIIKAEPDRDNAMIRHLKELKLWEYSFVAFPMNEEASITSVKSLRKTLDELKTHGYTEEEVKEALLKSGLLRNPKKSLPKEDESKELLRSLDEMIKTLRG